MKKITAMILTALCLLADSAGASYDRGYEDAVGGERRRGWSSTYRQGYADGLEASEEDRPDEENPTEEAEERTEFDRGYDHAVEGEEKETDEDEYQEGYTEGGGE